MLSIKAVSLNGQPLPSPSSAVFDERGGTLGRKEDCTLVLPDPERLISRHHALIEYRGGQFFVRDQGSGTPVYLNGQPLGNGREGALRSGDELRIGGYQLRVEAAQAQTAGPNPDDPFAAFGLTPPSPARAPMEERTGGAIPGKPFIPADFDPFAELKPTPSAPDPASQLGSGMGVSAPQQSIDALFGLSNTPGNADPFGLNSATPSQTHPNLSADPLAAMGFTEPAKIDVTPAQRNDTPEIFGSFKLPEIKLEPLHLTEPTAQRVAPASMPAPVSASSADTIPPAMPDSRTEPANATGAFSALGTEPQSTLYQPSSPAAGAPKDDPLALFGVEPAGSQSTPLFEMPAATPVRQQPGPMALSDAEKPAPPLPQSGTESELLQAFLQGLGVPEMELNGGLNPEFMNQLGKLMREMTQGTLDLLLARSLTKREVRAEMTMIEVRENNPLKFSPTVEVALTHLLAPPMRGFLPPLKAVKGAYDDLRSHQLGFMAGIQGALAGVLARFNPEQLEKRLTQKSVIDSVLPMHRRAKLWDLFNELYGDISKEAEDDFHALFGKEFVKAYEQQIAKLESEGNS